MSRPRSLHAPTSRRALAAPGGRHARQRAGSSLDEVIVELQLRYKISLEILDEGGSLELAARDLISEAILLAIRHAVRKSGEPLLADVSITPIYDDGVVSGFTKVVQDLTEHDAHVDAQHTSDGPASVMTVEQAGGR